MVPFFGRHRWTPFYVAATVGYCLVMCYVRLAFSQEAEPTASAEVDEELLKQQKIVERFLTVLEKNPRRGTALDRIYGFHVENGTLESLVKNFQDRTVKDSRDGVAWTILGLIEAQRGKDAAAVEAFTKATDVSEKDPLPAFYLGQSLVLVGQPDNAVKAFELAISRKPASRDLLEIFQALGKVHQRAQRTTEALAVWDRLEKLFPGDANIQEQIALTLVEEGDSAQALPRYEALIKITKDDYRKSVYRIQAAVLKVNLNRSAEAVADLETLLGTLNPTSWLYREVRRKVEDVYLRSDDQEGLSKYYEGWIAKHPEDVDAMARLARLYARQARVPEAQTLLDKALKLAPTRKDLRQAFIAQLVDEQRYSDAIAQYVLLDKADPNNPDYLREWGKLLLRDSSQPKAERIVAAEKIWRRLQAARPKDPLIATQVADLFRHADMSEPALALYRKGVELAPDQPQYLEYLGEYLHHLKKPEEAIVTWRQITEGKKKTAENLTRLAEVLSSFGYLAEALPEIEAACKLDTKDLSLQMKAADLFAKAEKYVEALAALQQAEKLTQNDDERGLVLDAQLKIYQQDQSLERRVADLAAKTAGGMGNVQDFYLLARFQESLRKYPEAIRSINEAMKLTPQSIPILVAASRIHEQSGELLVASDLNRKLAAVDRRGRSDYFKHISQLEMQLGRIDQALQAGKDLVASAPGNTENQEFYADLCFRLGRVDEGLQALRRTIRLNPNDPKLLVILADALSQQYRTEEAIQLFWQAFDKSRDLEAKLSHTQKLTNLYLQTNRFDKLLERIERLRSDSDNKRESTICLAQAHSTAGDYSMARQELESLLSDNTRDTELLQQLSKLSQTEGDLTSAIKYQEQLAKLAPGAETELPLARLLSQVGANEESTAIFVRLTSKEEDLEKFLKNVDSLIASGQHDAARALAEIRLREEPKNWELLYREGVALAKSNPVEAAHRFETIIALQREPDELSIAEKNRRVKVAKSSGVNGFINLQSSRSQSIQYASQIRVAVGLEGSSNIYYSGGPSRQSFWGPERYELARFAALGWLVRLARNAKEEDAFVAAYKLAAEPKEATATVLWDWLYVQSLVSGDDRRSPQVAAETLRIAKRLAAAGDFGGQQLLFQQISSRSTLYSAARQATTSPLPADDLALLEETYASIAKHNADSSNTSLFSQDYYFLRILIAELRRAGRSEQANVLQQQLFDKAKEPQELAQAIEVGTDAYDSKEFAVQFERWAGAMSKVKAPKSNNVESLMAHALQLAMGRLGFEKKNTEVLQVLDLWLNYYQKNVAQNKSGKNVKPKVVNARNSQIYVGIYYGTNQNGVTMSQETNEYFSPSTLAILRNAYEVFKANDVLSDLQKHLSKRLELAADENKIVAHLALMYFCTWSDEKEGALRHLQQASAFAPQDVQLRLELVQMLIELNDFSAAMAALDSINPLDHEVMQRKELMALSLAQRLGNLERARQAAERLFAVRLDAETQLQLADQMRQMGMKEEAAAVLSRAQRQVGNQLSTLVTVMGLHQAEGRPEIAAQIAHQILRRSQPIRSTNPRLSSSQENLRPLAIKVLATSGKLQEMIASTQNQLKRSPESRQLLQTLSEYYEASGSVDKSLEIEDKLVKLAPDDHIARYQYAVKLTKANRISEACDQYTVILQKSPMMVLQNDLLMISRLYTRAKKEADLQKVIERLDFRQLGQQSYILSNLITDSSGRPESRAFAVAILKKAIEAYPHEADQFYRAIYNGDLWNDPTIYPLFRNSFLPSGPEESLDPWFGLSRLVNSYYGDGKVGAPILKLLDAAAQRNDLAALQTDIQSAIAKYPSWQAGPIMAAMVGLRQGNRELAKTAVAKLLESTEIRKVPVLAKRIFAQELETHEEFKDLAVRVYESYLESDDAIQDDNGLQTSVASRLIPIYVTSGRKADAKRLLKKAEKARYLSNSSDPGYRAYQQIINRMQLARFYQELSEPFEAWRMYRSVVGQIDTDRDVVLSYVGDISQYKEQAIQGLSIAERELASLRDSGKIRDVLESCVSSRVEGSNDASLDLMVDLLVSKDGIPTLDSAVGSFFTKRKPSKETLAVTQTFLTELTAANPDDLNTQMLVAMVALQGNDMRLQKKSLEVLRKLVEAKPLEELAVGIRANSRQRAFALEQVSLSLVAQECRRQPDHTEFAEWFEARSLVAAERQIDSKYVIAILYAKLIAVLQKGDKAAAEVQIAELMKRLAFATPTKQAAPFTFSQFTIASKLALLAAENDLYEVSLDIVTKSLAGGVPVPDAVPGLSKNSRARAVRLSNGSPSQQDGDSAQAITLVNQQVVQLCQVWRGKKVAPEQICRVLEGLIFPQAQPGRIVLFERKLTDWDRPVSLGREFVFWSVAAGKADALQKKLEGFSNFPATATEQNVLLALLAIESKQTDAAKNALKGLSEQLEDQNRADIAALAGHVTGPAMQVEVLQEDTVKLLTQITGALEGNYDQMTGGMKLLTRYYIAQGRTKELKPLFELRMKANQRQYSQYSDIDYGLYQQRNMLAQFIDEIAVAGDLTLSLEYFGKLLDIPANSRYGNGVSNTKPLWHVVSQVERIPAEERYQVLAAWTLPSKDRRTLRVVTSYLPPPSLPTSFLPAELAVLKTPPSGLASTATLLVDAAKEANKLEELQAAIDSAVAEGIPHAEMMATLLVLAKDSSSPTKELQLLMKRIRDRIAEHAAKPAPMGQGREVTDPGLDLRWDDLLVLQAASRSTVAKLETEQLGRLILRENRTRADYPKVSLTNHLIGMAALEGLTELERQQIRVPHLKWWHVGTGSQTTSGSNSPAWWAVQDNQLTHVVGHKYDSLFFKYPLTGTFEFSFETHSYNFSQGDVAYGGLLSVPQFWDKNVTIRPVSMQDVVTRGDCGVAADNWNQMMVRVSPQKTSFFCNGHLVYEETEPSNTSPWLHLAAHDHRWSNFRNLKLSGEPTIPREVRLITADRMEGWAGNSWEALPTRLISREPRKPLTGNGYQYGTNSPQWEAEEGVLKGKANSQYGDNRTHIQYHRPLQSGDSVRYQFLYEPGKKLVHPALGSLVFLLEPTGIRLHASLGYAGTGVVELKNKNAVDEPTNRRGERVLPLRAGAWNDVQLALDGDQLTLTLNGEVVYVRVMEEANSRMFGLCHYPGESEALVREVILTGKWPEKIAGEELVNLLATTASGVGSPALQRARQKLVREEEIVEDTYGVWIQSQTLALEERYAYLMAWVLPRAERAHFRIQMDFTPTDPVVASPALAETGAETRQHLGGKLVSPAIALVETAIALQKQEELLAAIEASKPFAPGEEREVVALQTLVAIAREDDAAATAGLKKLRELLSSVDSATPVYQRHVEFIVAYAALDRTALRTAALPLAELIVHGQQTVETYQTWQWERRVRWLRAQARYLAAVDSAERDHKPKLSSKQWAMVSHATAESRGRGYAPGAWQLEKGKATFLTGHGSDSLYFSSPLQGDLEIRYRVGTTDWREMYVRYTGVGFDMYGEGTIVRRNLLTRAFTLRPPLSTINNWGEEVECRLVRKGNELAVYFNDTLAHLEPQESNVDPWIAILAQQSQYSGSVKNLQILGTPSIPESLKISASPNLFSWRADYFDETVDGPTANWTKSNDEIVGNQQENSPNSNRESILYYHRPMLEDGEIEYEFFYEAGKTEVAPAMDRAVFLLRPDGVKVHQLTDGAYDRSGVLPQNETPLASSPKALVLRENEWNTLKLTLVQNTVSLALNGTPIGEYSLESNNQRIFGLFHYRDAVKTRVRNVTYRGNWPKTFPVKEEQDLAESK